MTPRDTTTAHSALDRAARRRALLEQEGPAPRRIVNLDLDAPLPDLVRDERYDTAMVVGWRRGVPIGSVDIELGTTPDVAAAQLDGLLNTPSPDLAPDAGSSTVLPSVSVVVCTMVARIEDLKRLLAGFSALHYDGEVEFIIVDNRTVDPEVDLLPDLVAPYPEIRVVHQRRAGIAAARNAGLEAARNEVVAYVDDDVRVDENWLAVVGERFSRADRIDVLTGMILPAELETPAQFWFERYYGGFAGKRLYAPAVLRAVTDIPKIVRGSRLSASDVHGTENARFAVYGMGAYGAGANMSFRRSTLLAQGGFDNALGPGTKAPAGEDLGTLIRLLWSGALLAFEPGAVVHHRHRRTLEELEHQLHGYGLGFTALLSSLVAGDPRHLLGLAWQVPLASVTIAKESVNRVLKKSRGARALPTDGDDAPFAHAFLLDTGYPRSLVFHELSGYPKGPLAYVRSRRWWKATQVGKRDPELVRAGTK